MFFRLTYRTWIEVSLLVLISSFICFWNLGKQSFLPSDESLHVKAVQSMVHEGRFLLPTVDGEPYFRKPPFKMWISFLAVKILGESTFSYRIVDATLGVFTVILTYYLGIQIFGSSVAGFVAGIALLGCRYWIIYHGVRSGVQDSMLVFLSTLITALGWKASLLLNDKTKAHTRELSYTLALVGIFTGCAVLTKNVAGFLPLGLLGLFLLFSGDWRLVKSRRIYAVLLVPLFSFLLPGLFFGGHALFTPGAWETMIEEEVVDRFHRGLHNSRETFFFLRGLFWYEAAVPSVLLALSLLYFVAKYYRSRSPSYLLLILWCVVPVLAFELLSSKLPWYIAPTFPAMALLIGETVQRAAQVLSSSRVEWRTTEYAACTYLLYALYALPFHLLVVFTQIVSPPRQPYLSQRNTFELPNLHFRRTFGSLLLRQEPPRTVSVERMVRDVQKLTHTYPNLQILKYKIGSLAQHESIYLSMVQQRTREWDGKSGVTEPTIILVPFEFVSEIRSPWPFKAIGLLPPENRSSPHSWHRRINWILAFSPNIEPVGLSFFRSPETIFELAAPEVTPIYGLASPNVLVGIRARKSVGDRSAFTISDGTLYSILGAEFALRIQRAREGLDSILVDIFLNEVLIGTASLKGKDVNEMRYIVPANNWMRGSNLITLRYRKENQEPITPAESVVLLFDVKLTPRPPVRAE